MPNCYLFSYFKEEDGIDGLHLAYSHDGLIWTALKNDTSFLKPAPSIGDGIMRDPSVFFGPDGLFHLVWTVSWHGKGIGYASSPDLIQWSKQEYLPLMEHEPRVRNTWAPEIVRDEERNQFLIFWSSTVPGRHPESDDQSKHGPPHPGLNNRIYFVATRDFRSFGKTMLLHDPGFNVIDACIRRVGDRYAMFMKDETNLPFAAQKNIRIAFSDRATGPYGPASDPITGNRWCEGPSALKIDATWFVYVDCFREGRYATVASKDLKAWEDVSDRVRFPEGAKHGTALEIPPPVLSRLLSL